MIRIAGLEGLDPDNLDLIGRQRETPTFRKRLDNTYFFPDVEKTLKALFLQQNFPRMYIGEIIEESPLEIVEKALGIPPQKASPSSFQNREPGRGFFGQDFFA